MLEILKKTFGFAQFRPYQEEIIRQICAKRDVIAVMPTGGGKSLCYQLPAKLLHGTVIVVSPLISLMKDQVDGAFEVGLKAAFLNSSQDLCESREIIRQLKANQLEMLYIAPERFSLDSFFNLIKNVAVSFFAIDEAHCISEWGHDFRPDYLNLSVIRPNFPGIPIGAFTATATLKVQDDVTQKLNLKNPYTIRASFNRPNLFYRVEKKDDAREQVLSFIENHKNLPGIVYRTTRKSVDELCSFLRQNGIRALGYHAGLTQEDRRKNQEAFNNDEIQVMAATIAFGMGIDKSNVRFIIHADLPKNIEGYYQETGRAGRDSEPAECLLLFGRGDIPKLRYFLDQIENETERASAVSKLNQMARYAAHLVCRRRQLLDYFGETYPEENCGTCDVCTGKQSRVDITTDSYMIMSAILRSGERFGKSHIIDIVLGNETKRIKKYMHQNLKTFGVGKAKDKQHFGFIVDELLSCGLLCQEGDKYPYLRMTESGRKILFEKRKISAVIMETPRDQPHETNAASFDPVLFERLKDLRKKLAAAYKVAPYIVFSDRTLHEMAYYFPQDRESLLKMNGVGEKKMTTYGDFFLSGIKAFMSENPQLKSREKPRERMERNRKTEKGQTADVTFGLFRKGLSPSQIAEARNLSVTTIASHLEKIILDGNDVDMSRLVDKGKLETLENFYLQYDTWNLTPVVEYFNGTISYEEARYARAWVKRKHQIDN